MPGRPADADAEERITYTYEPDERDWRDWTNTVPRATPLYRRLDTLLAYDREHDLDALVETAESDADPDEPTTPQEQIAAADADDLDAALEALEPGVDADTVSVAMVRIRRRCMTGLPDAREHGADRAAEELSEIQDIANRVLEGE